LTRSSLSGEFLRKYHIKRNEKVKKWEKKKNYYTESEHYFRETWKIKGAKANTYISGIARIAEGGGKKFLKDLAILNIIGVANYVLIFSGVTVSPDFSPLNLNDP